MSSQGSQEGEIPETGSPQRKRAFQRSEHGSPQGSPQKVAKSVSIKFLELGPVVQKAFTSQVITEWEHKFYKDIHGKESLSEKQLHNKAKIELKIDLSAAKDKSALTDFEQTFTLDNFGRDFNSLSPKQLAVKSKVDAKLRYWSAFKMKAIDDWDLNFMVSNVGKETLSWKQKPIMERINKQLEAASAVSEGQALTEWELKFYVEKDRREEFALSEKQQHIMKRIRSKLSAWTARSSGYITDWEFGFYKNCPGGHPGQRAPHREAAQDETED